MEMAEDEQPALTSRRIDEMRARLADCFRNLRRRYLEAFDPKSDSEARARANARRDDMLKAVMETIAEYNSSHIPTRSEEYAANELLSEIKVYQDALDNEFLPLLLAEDELRTSPIQTGACRDSDDSSEPKSGNSS